MEGSEFVPLPASSPRLSPEEIAEGRRLQEALQAARDTYARVVTQARVDPSISTKREGAAICEADDALELFVLQHADALLAAAEREPGWVAQVEGSEMLAIEFVNDLTGTDEKANYNVTVRVNDKVIDRVRVEGHPRIIGWMGLTLRMLSAKGIIRDSVYVEPHATQAELTALRAELAASVQEKAGLRDGAEMAASAANRETLRADKAIGLLETLYAQMGDLIGDYEDCDDCGDIESRPCRIHGPESNAIYHSMRDVARLIGPCVCGHVLDEHHDVDTTKCKECPCEAFRHPPKAALTSPRSSDAGRGEAGGATWECASCSTINDPADGRESMWSSRCYNCGDLKESAGGATPETKDEPRKTCNATSHVFLNKNGVDHTPPSGTLCECGEVRYFDGPR